MDLPTIEYLKRLTTEECERTRENLSGVVKYSPSTSGNGSISLVKREDWFAVPIVIDGGFFPKTLEGFVKAAKSYGRSEIVATWIAPINADSAPVAFSVPSIIEAVREFNLDIDLLLMNSAAFAGKPDWVYIWLIDYIDIIYGTEAIAQIFTDTSVDEAFATFRTWLDESPVARATREDFARKGTENTLERVYRDLKQFNNASRATEVIIDWF